MKTSYLSSFVFFFLSLLIFSAPTHAQGPNAELKKDLMDSIKEQKRVVKDDNAALRRQMITATGTPAAQFREQIRENNRELKATITQERKGFLSQTKITIITKIYENAKKQLEKRYQALIDYRQKIMDKLNKRKDQGQDVTAALNKLNDFTSHQTSYTQHMAALQDKFEEIKKSDNPLSLVSDLRQSVKLVETDLQNMRKVEVEALKLVINN